jgi:hypothetical protein
MANAIAFCEFGQLLRWSVFFKIGRRTAQHVPPGGKAADDETGIGRQRQPDRKVESLVDQIDGSLAHGQIDLGVGVGRQQFGGYSYLWHVPLLLRTSTQDEKTAPEMLF